MTVFENNILVILLASLCLFSKNNKAKDLFYIIVCCQLCILLIFRDWESCGIDLFRYNTSYEWFKCVNINEALNIRDGANILFFFTSAFFAKANIDFQVFVSLISAIYIPSVIFLYWKKTNYPLISIFIFLGMGAFIFSFSGLKQTLAMTFVIWAYLLHDIGKNKLTFLLLLIAVLYHPTALILLPFFLIRKIPITKNIFYLNLFIFIIVLFFRMQIGQVLTLIYAEEYIGRYESTGDLTGVALFLIILFTLLLFFKPVSNKIYRDEQYIIFNDSFYILFFGVLIQLCASYSYSFTRLNYYYILFLPIAISNIIDFSKAKPLFRITGLKYVVFCVFMIYLMSSLYFEGVKSEELEDYQKVSII